MCYMIFNKGHNRMEKSITLMTSPERVEAHIIAALNIMGCTI